mmetsp:Transcript_12501/g.36193  ORF Transcript_12501/g.36193 Transcript_12501/m.36193 type:complete len:228 (+) Transcript_12501:739-1422(+)
MYTRRNTRWYSPSDRLGAGSAPSVWLTAKAMTPGWSFGSPFFLFPDLPLFLPSKRSWISLGSAMKFAARSLSQPRSLAVRSALATRWALTASGSSLCTRQGARCTTSRYFRNQRSTTVEADDALKEDTDPAMTKSRDRGFSIVTYWLARTNPRSWLVGGEPKSSCFIKASLSSKLLSVGATTSLEKAALGSTKNASLYPSASRRSARARLSAVTSTRPCTNTSPLMR